MVSLSRQMITAALLACGLFIFMTAHLVLAQAPTVSVVAPSSTEGDFGASQGNVWDMDSTNDIVWVQPNTSGGTTSYTVDTSFTDIYGSALRGVTPQGSDLASAFYTNSDTSIDGAQYYYFIMRLYIPNKGAGEAGTGATNGRVLYTANWSDNWLFDALPTRRFTKPYLVHTQGCTYGAWCVYYFDLRDSLGSNQSPNNWDWGQSGSSIESFGIWPHENWADGSGNPSGDSPDFFYLDYAYLTGDIVASEPPASQYTVQWSVSDTDTVTSTLYYQEQDELLLPANSPTCDSSLTGWTEISGSTSVYNPNPGGGAFQIYLPLIFNSTTASGSGLANQSFVWDLSSGTYTTGKVYYVCVEAVDSGGNSSYANSSAPVIKVPTKGVMTDD